MIFLATLSASFMMAATSIDPTDYDKAPGRRTLEIWVMIMTIWFICDEVTELKR